MFVSQYIDNSFPYLKSSDTIDFAIQLMEENGVHFLPVIKNGKYIGMATENTLFEFPNTNVELGTIDLPCQRAICGSMDHLFMALKEMGKNKLPILPVLNEKKKFLGTITDSKIVDLFANNSSIEDPGGILVLEIEYRDYSLTEISKIVESDGGLILHSYISQIPKSSKIWVTIKTNKTDISPIILSFERYNYEIKAAFNKSIQDQQLKERLDGLLMYLNI